MGFWTGNTPERLQLYEMDGDTLVLPFGCLRWVMACMNGKDSIDLNMTQAQMVWYLTVPAMADSVRYDQDALPDICPVLS